MKIVDAVVLLHHHEVERDRHPVHRARELCAARGAAIERDIGACELALVAHADERLIDEHIERNIFDVFAHRVRDYRAVRSVPERERRLGDTKALPSGS